MKSWLPLLLIGCSTACADDLAALVRDRAAVDRVYYNHRLGQKPPFEQTLPPATLEKLVGLDLRTEAVLRKSYSVTITPAMLDGEVQRINTTTRAPEMLAEIKAALGNDPVKFANVFAKPILVERELREHFDNDDALHASQRRQAETLRNQLLQAGVQLRGAEGGATAAKPEVRNAGAEGVASSLVALLRTNTAGQFSEATWQLGRRPAETNAPGADELEMKQRFGPNAQLISSPQREKERKSYFEDLPPALQNVLRVQLRQPGNVSAVIETPGGFLLYLCTGRTAETLSVAMVSLPKRNYDQWLAEQNL